MSYPPWGFRSNGGLGDTVNGEKAMNSGIELELAAAVRHRRRPTLDDIDASDLLEELKTLRAAREETTCLKNKLFDKRVEVHDLKHALKTLLCDTEESEYMSGKEREQKARRLLVDLGE